MASSSSNSGVPPGFRFHPTDEELLLYYLKKKVSFETFDLEVIKDVDLNKMEPWDLQEKCRIGSTPQNEWYFFSHKDRKYPTGSRTNRATNVGFWKATGRDKSIRTTYKKIGMRKTLVFYRGRAPYGQKTDWIMHEYRLEDSDDPQGGGNEDGWVVCKVFKKKCFFKPGIEGNTSQGTESHSNTTTGHDEARAQSFVDPQYIHQNLHHNNHNHAPSLYNLHYQPLPALTYSQVQVQDLLPGHRPSGYDFPVLPSDTSAVAKTYESGLGVAACEPMQQVGEGRDQSANQWGMLASMEGRFANNSSGAIAPQMNQISGQRGGEMDLWGYGK